MSAPQEGRSYLPPEEPLEKECPLASASLLLGVLSWFFIPVLGGILAVILGHQARIRIARSEGKLTGDALAVAGLWLGYANIGVAALIGICFASFILISVIGKLLSQ